MVTILLEHWDVLACLLIGIIAWLKVVHSFLQIKYNKKSRLSHEFKTCCRTPEEGIKEIRRAFAPHPLDENPANTVYQQVDESSIRVQKGGVTWLFQFVECNGEICLSASADYSDSRNRYLAILAVHVFLIAPLILGIVVWTLLSLQPGAFFFSVGIAVLLVVLIVVPTNFVVDSYQVRSLEAFDGIHGVGTHLTPLDPLPDDDSRQ